jgi:hypothetical protein
MVVMWLNLTRGRPSSSPGSLGATLSAVVSSGRETPSLACLLHAHSSVIRTLGLGGGSGACAAGKRRSGRSLRE